MALLVVVLAAIGVTAVQTISMMSVQSASAEPDRCTSVIESSSGLTARLCGQTKEEQQINREHCREEQDAGFIEKCSSSQTGFGTRPNFKIK